MNMKMNFGVALAPLVFLITACCAQAQDPQERTPVAVSQAVTLRATIVAIDKDNRILTLRGPRGQLVDIKADERIRRFDELNVGDVISATYSESVAVRLRRPGEPEPDRERVVVRPQRQPGASVEDIRTRTVTVEDVDRASAMITVRDPEGNIRSYRMRDPERLEGVKNGDSVDISYTTALLLKVD